MLSILSVPHCNSVRDNFLLCYSLYSKRHAPKTGDALLLCISVPTERKSMRLKVQFASNELVNGKAVRVNFMQILDSLCIIDKTGSVNPTLPPESQVPILPAASVAPSLQVHCWFDDWFLRFFHDPQSAVFHALFLLFVSAEQCS